MREDLLAQLDEWHEEDKFEEIVDAIMEIPAEDRDDVLISHLGRAMNNLERYEEAIEQFLTIAEEGKEDPLWHYRMGLAHYYLDQYDDALREFEIADQLDPEDEDTLEFLDSIRSKMAEEQEPLEDSDAEPIAQPIVMPVPDLDTNIDLVNFWDDSEQAAEQYVSDPPTEDLIASVEEELVFKLPAFYIQMMKLHNGGIPQNKSFPIGGTASGAQEHIMISGILGIGREKQHSLCGDSGSRFVIEHGGYPEVGVVICDCPSESAVVMLDYRSSGNDGEPEVIYVDKESNYQITRLAPNFEAFIRGLVNEEMYDIEQ
ncbi:SMI1/KNR4 family protein [Paenibacillus dokdonensis]|uniref:SMI1/KNR4 family protein n=1 Tax=Paenibacillus dokdonensis TaxID=2567944 RepID=A0ABU6GLI6_9BACL|nr:SMI1/KNR4 family protein [Paenibacillus dokdonensis]MEC0240619.1 SMI1/KNR4 family protein [Paenibacillus dokdonensis]